MSSLKVAIRADATARIGTGHLMRCLTLARLLKDRGAQIRFVSRGLLDSMHELITQAGMEYRALPESNLASPMVDSSGPAHAAWLGASQTTDAEQTRAALADRDWDWLVVDHYAIDWRWEEAMASIGARLLCIDDLADRPHVCDLLLDQNYYVGAEQRYQGLVPATCQLLLGPANALLRDEFRAKQQSVKVRKGRVNRLLIFFGGVDKDNLTERALDALALLPHVDFSVDVVIGAQHPARAHLVARCTAEGYHCHVQTQRMAELMVDADLAIGGGGATTLERAAMGLPSMVVVLADNQRQSVEDMAAAGLLVNLGEAAELSAHDLFQVLNGIFADTALRTTLSRNGLALTPFREKHPLLALMETKRV